MSTTAHDYIQPVHINDYLIYFYWGRHPDHHYPDMHYGGGAHALHKDGTAILIDTMCLPGQAEWIKNYLQTQCSVERFKVVNTHWHNDHICGNHVVGDGEIIGHTRTRELMLKHWDELEQGSSEGPGFPVRPPNVTFEERLDLWLGDLKVELHHFDIHVEGHVCVFLPEDGILVAGDMLEDPVWVLEFGFATPEKHFAEFERMLAMDIKHIFATHIDLDTVKTGGYDKKFIQHSINYLRRMLEKSEHPEFNNMDAQEFIRDALDAGELHWWEPYAELHASNREVIAKLDR